MSRHRFDEDRFDRLVGNVRSGPRFKDLPIGTLFEWNTDKGVNYPMKGIVLKKVSDTNVVAEMGDGAPVPVALTPATREERDHWRELQEILQWR